MGKLRLFFKINAIFLLQIRNVGEQRRRQHFAEKEFDKVAIIMILRM